MDSTQRRLKYSVHRGPESTLHSLNTSFLPLRFASSPGSDTSPYHINMPIKPTSASLPGRCQSRDHSSRRDANRPWDTGMLACRPTGTQHGGTGSSLSRIHRFHSFPQRRPFRHHRTNPPLSLTQTTLFLQALNPPTAVKKGDAGGPPGFVPFRVWGPITSAPTT
jgi:hypothetical protein